VHSVLQQTAPASPVKIKLVMSRQAQVLTRGVCWLGARSVLSQGPTDNRVDNNSNGSIIAVRSSPVRCPPRVARVARHVDECRSTCLPYTHLAPHCRQLHVVLGGNAVKEPPLAHAPGPGPVAVVVVMCITPARR
jgi:hypothetical protein